jgi:adenosylcobinamide-GDP ribazoletransferase
VSGRLAREGRYLATAFSLLTRLPAPGLAGFEEDWLARSVPYFPVVGLVVGGAAAAAWRGAALLWPGGFVGAVAALAAITAGAWLTGGLHEDGWADLFDGLAAGRGGDRERMLKAMKDSAIGATGALALALLLLAKLEALATIAGISGRPAAEVPRALLAAHILSRWSNLPLLWRLPYVRPEGGMGRAFAGRVAGGRVAAGSALALLLAVAVFAGSPRPLLAATLTATVATVAAGLFFRRRLGGITGDCLGAAQQLVELAVLLALAARWPALP